MVNRDNLFWHAYETWRALYGDSNPYYDDPKTDETQTKQFHGMLRLISDAIDGSPKSYEPEITRPKFVSFDETNPEHSLCDMQMEQADLDRDFDDCVERYWDDEEKRFVLRDNPFWDANATVQWNEFTDHLNHWDVYPWVTEAERAAYVTELDRFIEKHCG